MRHARPAKRKVQRIEIAGGIASGKTTLARLLGQNGRINAVHEQFRKNPFFEAFYRDPVGTAFETELAFLLQHYHLQRSAIRLNAPYCADFSAVLDHAYACVTLGRIERKLFESILGRTEKVLQRRALLIVLDCPADIQLARIRRRNRAAESSISLGYLRKVNRALASRVASLPASEEILRIDSGVVNFARDRAAARTVLQQIKSALVH
jgi:deoxyadenosine/deoxycytidine kinase